MLKFKELRAKGFVTQSILPAIKPCTLSPASAIAAAANLPKGFSTPTSHSALPPLLLNGCGSSPMMTDAPAPARV
jgi:hypothetical protein